LFTSKIADSVIEGRALATEHDFTTEKVVSDETAVEDLAEYSQYVDPKYAEQIMQESLMLDDTTASSRKGPASETSEPVASEASQV
jgi:small subunit ribosomal protein S2